MAQEARLLPHFFLPFTGKRESYTSPRSNRGKLPLRQRRAHARKLSHELQNALRQGRLQLQRRDQNIAEGEPGFSLQFIVPTKVFDPAAFEDLRQGVLVLSAVLLDDERSRVTVFVPESASGLFPEKLRKYEHEDTPKGRPKNAGKFERIDAIGFAGLKSLWTDPVEAFPVEGQVTWWEVWLIDDRAAEFLRVAEKLGIHIADNPLFFPQREVRLARAESEQLESAVINSDAVAELRLARDLPARVLELSASDQLDLAGTLRDKTSAPAANSPVVCLLETGVSEAHPLLSVALDPADVHEIDPAWGTDDAWNHGTAMSGLALYGDLNMAAGRTAIRLTHRLEHVKIVPSDPFQTPDPKLYGSVVRSSVAAVENHAPQQIRIFGSAITSITESTGIPTQWSAEIDKLAAERDSERLFIVAVGNVQEIKRSTYLSANDTLLVRDPAQAWNALSVGAYTEKIAINDPAYSGFSAISPRGGLSPWSRTSVAWARQWPIKPDVLFEGGNLATAPSVDDAQYVDDLGLLSTNGAYVRSGAFTSFTATSAATALASQFCGALRSHFPNAWPETIRGLTVHSARWTDEMRAHLGTTVAEKSSMVRRYGYGVPHYTRAHWSFQNDLTMVIQSSLQPFRIGDKGKLRNNEMALFALPWPRELLLSMGASPVRLRITLSYFVEPNPSRRGFKGRYEYASHGLRFDLKRAGETIEQFRKRINKAVRDENYGRVQGGDEDFVLGSHVRNHGSIHSDIWSGTAADLAERSAVGVVPITGWWKEIKGQGQWNRQARFALLVTLETSDVEIDLYTPVEAAIEAMIGTGIEV